MAAKTGAVRAIALGWAAFTGTHLVMSHEPVREKLINTMGEKRFAGAYSLVAFGTFIPTTYYYVRYGRGQGIVPGWTSLTQTRPMRYLGLATKVTAAIGFGQAISAPNPIAESAFKTDDKAAPKVEVTGVYRITRHAMFSSVALLGIGNILTRGHAGDLVYWAGFPTVWLLGCAHQDTRKRNELPKEFYDSTSLVPFAAIVEGRNSLKEAFKEFNKPAFVMAFIAPLFLWL
eukprot:TRINITY_DN20661_c0_g1_i1.p1 TRINITY_DN20661_c0_g1~~TRINITY_DN20661_c0_g1_i1.p1  ORF type:complete len:231 (+),score=24.84 TRINITY_DN20661_c0_g1_i1:245-937(+)